MGTSWLKITCRQAATSLWHEPLDSCSHAASSPAAQLCCVYNSGECPLAHLWGVKAHHSIALVAAQMVLEHMGVERFATGAHHIPQHVCVIAEGQTMEHDLQGSSSSSSSSWRMCCD